MKITIRGFVAGVIGVVLLLAFTALASASPPTKQIKHFSVSQKIAENVPIIEQSVFSNDAELATYMIQEFQVAGIPPINTFRKNEVVARARNGGSETSIGNLYNNRLTGTFVFADTMQMRT